MEDHGRDINAFGRLLGKRAKEFSQQRAAITQYPHCDQMVLHAPGECEYCDSHPDWQELREVWNINYTGHSDPQKMQCPAEARRPAGIINRWGGNVPTNLEVLEVIQEEDDAG